MSNTNNWKRNGEYMLVKEYEPGITGTICDFMLLEYYLNVLGMTINYSTTQTESLEQIQETVDNIYEEFKLKFIVTEDALSSYLENTSTITN